MKKRTYIVPVTYNIPVTVYYEEIATSAKKAKRKVKRHFRDRAIVDSSTARAFEDEAKTEVKDHWFLGGKVRVWSAERASQYHSEKDCAMCSSVLPKQRR
jgi:hypothetical protein